MFRRLKSAAFCALFLCLTACGADKSYPAYEDQSAVFFRIVKSSDGVKLDGYLEAFEQQADGSFIATKRWPICYYSGGLGPKLREGDGMSPEGFYFFKSSALNPNSSYHLSFNIGFPNAYDRAHGRTGSYLMVHGECVSIGCYAMTNDGIEEIYGLAKSALDNGQPFVRIHIFPFEMTEENLKRFESNENYEFWSNLKMGWDYFETHKTPPNVTVENLEYKFQ